MSHQLDFTNGKASMFSVGETPWHGHGEVLNHAPTSRQAMIYAQMNWNVQKVRLFTEQGDVLEDRFGIRREDNHKVIAVVGKTFQPLQNEDAFKYFDPFVQAGEASYETAGVLRGGRRVWILAKLNRDPSVIMGDDVVNKYVLLSNGHDGTMAVRTGFCPIRAVCANTLALAHQDSRSKLIRLRHTDRVVQNLESLREIMDMANSRFEASAEQYRLLAKKQINKDDLKKFVQVIFSQKKPEEGVEEAPPSEGRVFEAVERLFETGRGADLPAARGTAWGAYNAVNEYLNYERGSNGDVRLDSLWYGQGAKMNDKALQYAYVLATQ